MRSNLLNVVTFKAQSGTFIQNLTRLEDVLYYVL